jgi:hypothetical protein
MQGHNSDASAWCPGHALPMSRACTPDPRRRPPAHPPDRGPYSPRWRSWSPPRPPPCAAPTPLQRPGSRDPPARLLHAARRRRARPVERSGAAQQDDPRLRHTPLLTDVLDAVLPDDYRCAGTLPWRCRTWPQRHGYSLFPRPVARRHPRRLYQRGAHPAPGTHHQRPCRRPPRRRWTGPAPVRRHPPRRPSARAPDYLSQTAASLKTTDSGRG